MTGGVEALSLWVRVYSAAGEKLFESYGGLEPIQRMRVVDWKFHMEVRDDILEDSETLRDGIAVAFDPYLPRREREGG